MEHRPILLSSLVAPSGVLRFIIASLSRVSTLTRDIDNLDFKVTVLVVYAMHGIVFMQLTRDLFAIAKFLF